MVGLFTVFASFCPFYNASVLMNACSSENQFQMSGDRAIN